MRCHGASPTTAVGSLADGKQKRFRQGVNGTAVRQTPSLALQVGRYTDVLPFGICRACTTCTEVGVELRDGVEPEPAAPPTANEMRRIGEVSEYYGIKMISPPGS